jgi:hypothetical protein
MRRLASLPERIKLSMPNTSELGSASLILRANAQPTKPQMPVTKAFMKNNALTGKLSRSKEDLPLAV